MHTYNYDNHDCSKCFHAQITDLTSRTNELKCFGYSLCAGNIGTHTMPPTLATSTHWKNIDISYSLRGKEICRTCSHQIYFAWPASDIWNSYAPFLYCRTVHLELNES